MIRKVSGDATKNSRVVSFVSTQCPVVINLFGEDAAQLKQELGFEHAVSVDLALNLKDKV